MQKTKKKSKRHFVIRMLKMHELFHTKNLFRSVKGVGWRVEREKGSGGEREVSANSFLKVTAPGPNCSNLAIFIISLVYVSSRTVCAHVRSRQIFLFSPLAVAH